MMTCHNRNTRKSLEGMENGQPLWKTFLLVFCQSSTYVYNMTQQYTPQYSLKRHENRPTPRLVRDKSQQLLITRATNTGIDKRLWSVHSDTKEQNDNTHKNMGESQKYKAKRKIPNTPEKAEFEGEVGGKCLGDGADLS